MKKICILLFTISLTMPICLHGQISVYGEIPTTAHSNSIIRAWGNQFVIYAEDNYGQGVFHLLTGTTGGSQVFTANLPSLLYVYDFKILGDNVYFVGVRDTSTIVGVFNITSLFYYNGGYDLCELQAYSKYPNLYSPKALLRTEVYFLRRNCPLPVIKQNKGIIVDRGGMYDPYLFFPVITPNNFYVICTKDF